MSVSKGRDPNMKTDPKAAVRKQAEELREAVDQKTEVLKKNVGDAVVRGIRRTRALSFYLVKLGCRLTIFGILLGFYLYNRPALNEIVNQHFLYHFTALHIVWGIFMIIMIMHIIPNNRLSMAWRKARENVYREVPGYSELQLLRFVQIQNVRAWKVMLAWLSFNAVFGVLYLLDIIKSGDLLMLTVFYFLSDYICILFYCPFQSILMKNKCCINCRIYDWGHFMMFTPMLFIKNFFSWSLFFTSLVVLIHWEVNYSRHPERFWEGSNQTLQCAHCKEQTCQIKKKIAGKNMRQV